MVACQSITEAIGELGGSPDPAAWTEFRRLYGLLALRALPGGTFFEPNWWRGPLLYSLVRHYRPKALLEFGTGRGYGTACMAKALIDENIDGTVYSIDILPPDRPIDWPIDEGNGQQIRRYSRDQVWNKHLAVDLCRRIRCLTGTSADIMKRWRTMGLPNIDFCFIDAGHGYWDVKHDFITAAEIANIGSVFLFDDYTTRPSFGVHRLLDGEVMPRVPGSKLRVLDTLSQDPQEKGTSVPHLMALLPFGNSTPSEVFSAAEIRRFRRRHAVRARLLPFFRTIRQCLRPS